MFRGMVVSWLVGGAALGCSASGSTGDSPRDAASRAEAGAREATTPEGIDGGVARDVTSEAIQDEGRADASSSDVALPLSTCGRWIVDRNGRRVKLAGINWYGASDVRHVVGGLDKVPMAQIVQTIRTLGFNAIRLPFSNAMLNVADPVDPAAVAANPDLRGKTPLEVYDATVDALTRAGLLVILNNHTTHAMWCCGFDDDGLWYTSDYGEERWLADWDMLVKRYTANPRVVGADLRNELRPAKTNGTIVPTFVNWGQGGAGDWAAAAKRAGDRLLQDNPSLLIVVEGIDSADNLTGVKTAPIALAVPGKLVYEAHQYGFFPSPPGDFLHPYSGMSDAQIQSASHDKWGYILDPGQAFTAPVWLGELGDGSQSTWLTSFESYAHDVDVDFAYWAINGGPKPGGGAEPYGLLADDWTTVTTDARLMGIQGLMAATRGPGIDPRDTCP
jgi:aryl-phospho-beta-D-glucosidase BglC (GH1 family)